MEEPQTEAGDPGDPVAAWLRAHRIDADALEEGFPGFGD